MKQQPERTRKNSEGRAITLRVIKNPMAIVGICLVVVLCLGAIFAPVLTKYSPTEVDVPNAFQGPSLQHLAGTDNMGRDLFTRLLYGGRYSILLGVLSTLSALLIGVILGSLAGYFGGLTDNIIMRIMDVFQAMPGMLLAILISAVLGPGFWPTVVALSVSTIPGMSRMMRANILSVRGMEYIEAAKSIKCSNGRIILRHVIPNALSPMIVTTANHISSNIVIAAGLSFIGLGVQPPTAEWGAMLSASRSYVTGYAYMCLFPGIFICLFTIGCNLFGDALRDALDPTLKR